MKESLVSESARDAVIIGAGPGGYVAALRIAAMGGRATLVEQGALGGVCLNTGCIPTKALLHVSKLVAEIRSAEAMGVHVDGVQVDFAQMVAYKDKVLDRLRKGLTALLKQRDVQVLAGRGRLIDARTVGIDSPEGPIRLEPRGIVLATGTVPADLPGLEPDGQRVLNTDQLQSLTALPGSALLIGAGPNGVEGATLLAELGCKVTLVEAMDRVLPPADPEASKEVAKLLKKLGVTIHCGTTVEDLDRTGDNLVATLAGGKTVEADVVVVAVGRRTRIDAIGLDEAGVEHDGRFIRIDERCRTSAPDIYAIGDITGKGPYAHVAYRQAGVAASNIMGRGETEDYRVVPTVVFSHPEVAQVGLTEEQARAEGLDVEVGRFRYQACGAAQAFAEPAGFCKLIAEAGTHRLLGATLVGFRAAESIHEVAVVLRSGGTAEQIAETIHAHPSLSEPVVEAADALLGAPLHAL